MRVVDFRTIGIAQIEVGHRLRPVDEDHAQALATTMAQAGLIHPLEVTYAEGSLNSFKLISGAHRLAAAKLLGWTEIDVRLVEFGGNDPKDLDVYHESIENIARHELNALDRAATLAAAKGIYERLHPETKNGGDRSKRRGKNQNDTVSFSKSAASKAGLTPRSIERYVALYNSLAPAVRDSLAGTDYAGQRSQLVALAQLDPERQATVADILLDDSNEIRRVKEADAQIDTPRPARTNPADKAFKKLLSLYLHSPKKAQKEFRAWLSEHEATPSRRANGSARKPNGTPDTVDLEDLISAKEASA